MGSGVGGKLALQSLRLFLYSGKIMIVHVKCGLRATLCGWSYFDSSPSSPFPFPLTYTEVCHLFVLSFTSNHR